LVSTWPSILGSSIAGVSEPENPPDNSSSPEKPKKLPLSPWFLLKKAREGDVSILDKLRDRKTRGEDGHVRDILTFSAGRNIERAYHGNHE
jgi:hypothetical protein